MESKYHKWTTDEELLLKQLTEKYGLKWDLIRRRGFPYLSQVAIKNKYYSYRNPKYKGYTRYQKSGTAFTPETSTFKYDTDYLIQQIRVLLQNQ